MLTSAIGRKWPIVKFYITHRKPRREVAGKLTRIGDERRLNNFGACVESRSTHPRFIILLEKTALWLASRVFGL